MANSISEVLFQLGLSTPDSLEPCWPRRRDREDLSVLRFMISGVMLLSSTDQVGEATYRDNPGLSYWSADCLDDAWNATERDDSRRADDIRGWARGRSISTSDVARAE